MPCKKKQTFIILALLRRTCNEWRVHFRGLAHGQHSPEKTSQRRRTIDDTASDFIGPGIEPQTSRADIDVVTITSLKKARGILKQIHENYAQVSHTDTNFPWNSNGFVETRLFGEGHLGCKTVTEGSGSSQSPG